MNKPLTVTHVLPQHALYSLIACRTPITQLYPYSLAPVSRVSFRTNERGSGTKTTQTLTPSDTFWRQNPGLSSSGRRISFTECQQICLTINKYSHPNNGIRRSGRKNYAQGLLFRSANCLCNATPDYVLGRPEKRIIFKRQSKWFLFKSVQGGHANVSFPYFQSFKS